MRLLGIVAAAVAALPFAACGSDNDSRSTRAQPPVASPAAPDSAPAAPSHVHGLGVNPTDGALFVAAHEGLFRSGSEGAAFTLVGEVRDTMGFEVIGPDKFLASGHPSLQSTDPPLLGLIASVNAGRNWRSLNLEGDADLHVIRAGPGAFYAHDAAKNRVFAGSPGGSGLSLRTTPPGTTIDMAVDPDRGGRIYASTDRGLFLSNDAALNWRKVDPDRAGLLTFIGDTLVLVDGGSRVSLLPQPDGPWRTAGNLPGRPAAITSHGRDLLAATDDGSVYESQDLGRSWSVRIEGPMAASGSAESSAREAGHAQAGKPHSKAGSRGPRRRGAREVNRANASGPTAGDRDLAAPKAAE